MASGDAKSPIDPASMAPFSSYLDKTDDAKAVFDEKRAIAEEYGDLFRKMMMLEAEYYGIDSNSENANMINDQYESLSDRYAELGDKLYSGSYERFLKGQDYYYESSHYDLSLFDVTRAFESLEGTNNEMQMDIEERRSQEQMQMARMSNMIERGGPLVSLSGETGAINRLILKKVKTFGHPVQSVQLNNSDKMVLEQDLNNLESLKEDGLISYLLYKELKGDLVLF